MTDNIWIQRALGATTALLLVSILRWIDNRYNR